MLKSSFTIFIFILLSSMTYGQENWMLRGYIKGLVSAQTVDDGEWLMEGTVHNRLDFNWYISDHFTLTTGLRNRVIVGNTVSQIPDYGQFIGRDNGYFDLSWVWAEQNDWIGISQFDRLMLDYTTGNLQIIVGRQRINWGQTFVWNPNDLFNTYSYFDFDYEERPGTDALRVQYYIGESSKIEVSTSLDADSKITSSFLYRFNTKGYDIQFLGGVYTETDYIVGGGFSGSIAGGGFSGEFTYFHPMEDTDDSGSATATIHYDYTFSNSLNLQFETLYNGFGADDMSGGLEDVIFQDLNPKNLFPTKLAFFASGGYDLSPLWRVMLAGMYGPAGNFMYVGPTINYAMSNNMELAGFGQYYYMDEIQDGMGNLLVNSGFAAFIRYKWSF